MDIKKTRFGYLYIFLMLLVSDDTLMFGTNSHSSFQLLKFIIFVLMFFLLILLMVKENKNIEKRSIKLFMIFSFFIILTAIFNLDFKFGYVYRIGIFALALLTSNFFSFKELSYYYSRVISFLSIFSLIVFFIEVYFKQLLHIFPKIVNIVNNIYYNLFFSVVPLDNYGVARSYSIFREPGVFVVFIIIGLLIEIYYFEKKSLFRQVILLAALITTKSTTGYIVVVLIYLGYLLKKTMTNRDRQIKLVFFILSLISLYYILNHTNLIFSDNKYYSVFGKYEDIDKSNSRISSIIINLLLFLEKPFFGSGIDEVAVKFSNLGLKKYGVLTEHNTNTFLLQLSTYGLMFFSIYVYQAFLFCKNLNFSKNIVQTLLIFVVIFMILSGENLSNNLMLTSFIFYSQVLEKGDNIL